MSGRPQPAPPQGGEGAIPQPRPVEAGRVPPPPERRPAATALVALAPNDRPEIAILCKRTFDIVSGEPARLADEQLALEEDVVSYDAKPAGMASPFLLPELIGFKNGTDVVVQGTARPQGPVRETMVGVRVDAHVHAVRVFGRRLIERSGPALRFSEPEPFDLMPIRYENAYGGRDAAFEAAFMAEFKRITDPAHLRAMSAVTKHAFGVLHPLMYPRNRFGKGYVLGHDPGGAVGRELPNLELPRDLLTPERVLSEPLEWASQPIPAGFDFLDPFSFPRSSLMGAPPLVSANQDGFAEVTLGLVPALPTRTVVTATPETIGEVMHPSASRCASLGLWLPFLRGNEVVCLYGMDRDEPQLTFQLPGERVALGLRGLAGLQAITPVELHLVRVEADRRRLTQVWVQRFYHPHPADQGFAASASGAIEVKASVE